MSAGTFLLLGLQPCNAIYFYWNVMAKFIESNGLSLRVNHLCELEQPGAHFVNCRQVNCEVKVGYSLSLELDDRFHEFSHDIRVVKIETVLFG